MSAKFDNSSFSCSRDIIGAPTLKMGHVTLTMPLLKVFVVFMLGLDVVYLYTNFNHSGFYHSGDMIHCHQNLNSWHDLTTPLLGWFVIRGLSLAMINLPTKFKVYFRALWRYEKGYKMSKVGWFGVVRGYPRSLKIAPFDRVHASISPPQ